jgi:hypothetical protein
MQDLALQQLDRWDITPAQAQEAGIFDVPDASAVYAEFQPLPALVLPYHAADRTLMRYGPGAGKPFVRVRYLETPKARNGFIRAKPQRYEQPARSGTRAYFPPVVDWLRLLGSTKEPFIITEGEAKALCACLAGFPSLALGGVFNFMKGDELLPELAEIDWQRREVYIVFDSDAEDNPNILAAEARLVDELQRKRSARCYLVRIPGQEDGTKVGLDDFLKAHGPAGLVELLNAAPSLSALDAKVVALNKSVAWIERENLVYDLGARIFLPKDSFMVGSQYSAMKHIGIGATNRKEPKPISIAKEWLTHPHAQRFSEILFRPNAGATVTGDNGRPALNMWTGYDTPTYGDVSPFLELSEHLFARLRPEDRDLPVKLMAYKAQHPEEKIPLALVLLGEQGCGKTLWGEIVRDAFAPYGADVTPTALSGEFQGWLEKSLVALINEAKGKDMEAASEQLKALISDLRRPMNEKYRPVRQINTYTQYIITSNRREVGAFAPDDRRMIVVDCPKKREAEFYHGRVGPWKDAGGARAVMGYFLSLDLQGWRPPTTAPMSREKYMAFVESLTQVQRLAQEMRSADENTVKLWLDAALSWARVAELSSNPGMTSAAKATIENVNRFEIRPWYTPDELALMFPAIVQQTQGSMLRITPSGKISRELREAGVPYLQSLDDPRGFLWKGAIRQYLVVADFPEWEEPIHQADFERLMRTWPTYGAMVAGRRA